MATEINSNKKEIVKYIVLFVAFVVVVCVLYDMYRTTKTQIQNTKTTDDNDNDELESCTSCNSKKHTTDTCPQFDPTRYYHPSEKACRNKQFNFMHFDYTNDDTNKEEQPDEDYFFEELENQPRNPIKNVNSYTKNNKSSEQSIRDLNDGMFDLYKPVGAVDCEGSEKINKYLENRYDEDVENNVELVQRMNEFRKTDSRELVGKPIMAIYDKLSANKCYVKATPDTMGRDGYYISEGNNRTKSFMRDNWAYQNESPINGGSLGGTLYPTDPDSNDHTTIW